MGRCKNPVEAGTSKVQKKKEKIVKNGQFTSGQKREVADCKKKHHRLSSPLKEIKKNR